MQIPAFKIQSVIGAIFASVLCSLALCSVAFADPVVELTDEEISARFKEINDRYEVGELFSEEDGRFVLNYGTNDQTPAPYGTHNVNMSGGLKGTYVSVTGSVYHNGVVTYSYGGTLDIKKTAGNTPKKYVAKIRCTAYGPAGNGTGGSGVVKICDDTLSATKANSNTFTASLRGGYEGVMFSYVLEPTVVVTTSSGDVFTVHA